MLSTDDDGQSRRLALIVPVDYQVLHPAALGSDDIEDPGQVAGIKAMRLGEVARPGLDGSQAIRRHHRDVFVPLDLGNRYAGTHSLIKQPEQGLIDAINLRPQPLQGTRS